MSTPAPNTMATDATCASRPSTLKTSPKKRPAAKPTFAFLVVQIARQFGFDQLNLATKDHPPGLMGMFGSSLAVELRSSLPKWKKIRIYVTQTEIIFGVFLPFAVPLEKVDLESLIKYLSHTAFEVRITSK